MAGHSKWANIRHRKERVDAKRGRVFARLIKEVMVAAKMGGGNPDANSRLRLSLDRARAVNVPNDNIERAIKRATGQLGENVNYQEVRYEGYGIGGAAILVDCLTENKNRTFPDVRHTLSKYGGHLGTDGSVSYLFKRQGQLLFSEPKNKDALIDLAIETGADDFVEDGEGVEIICPPEQFQTLLEVLQAQNFEPDFADIVMRPDNEVNLTGEDATRMQKLLSAIEDLEDTQHIYTNANIQEDLS